jgi:hypothetical protein
VKLLPYDYEVMNLNPDNFLQKYKELQAYKIVHYIILD